MALQQLKSASQSTHNNFYIPYLSYIFVTNLSYPLWKVYRQNGQGLHITNVK